MYVNLLPLIEHKEIDLENLFLERFKKEEFEGSGGIGPSKWFELISIPGLEVPNLEDKSGSLPLIWMLARSKKENLLDRSQNQSGIVSEIPVLEMSSNSI